MNSMDKVFEHGLNVLITVLEMLPQKEEPRVTNNSEEFIRPKRGYENCRNNEIYHLRNVELDEKLMYQLTPFINSYKPLDSIPTKEQLMSDNRRPKDMSSPCSMDRLEGQKKEMDRRFIIGSKWWK